MNDSAPLRIAITATGTDLGKTWITTQLVQGLRGLGRRVWVHKPAACGDWDGETAGDTRPLRALCGDGQALETVSPLNFPTACSPHLAARIAGKPISFSELQKNCAAVSTGKHDLVVEGAGGLLSPLSDDYQGLAQLAAACQLGLVIVTRPDLGTLHHTAATVLVARQFGLPVWGLVVNEPDPVDHSDPAIASACDELHALCGVPVLSHTQHLCMAPAEITGIALARAILAARSSFPAS